MRILALVVCAVLCAGTIAGAIADPPIKFLFAGKVKASLAPVLKPPPSSAFLPSPRISGTNLEAKPGKNFQTIKGRWKLYRNQTHGFSFEYPALYEKADCSVHEDDKEVSLGSRSILQIHESRGLSLKNFVNKFIEEGELRVNHRSTRRVGNLDAIAIDYRLVGTNRYGTFTAAYAGKVIYVFDFTAGGGACDSVGVKEIDAYSHMIDSFRLEK
ncbi:MAG TPA: hypothetical protein VE135_10260 [Pyrinomonadaceae bacterium]|nr:hypothetical protein [Pyrinomonadaceae bacterium]